MFVVNHYKALTKIFKTTILKNFDNFQSFEIYQNQLLIKIQTTKKNLLKN